jgi:hypothetical protein
MENFSDKICRDNQSTHFVFNNFFSFFFRKSFRLLDTVERHGNAIQATDDVIWSMRIACWIPKATGTHSEYVLLLSLYNNDCANAPECDVIRTSLALF